MRYTFNVFDGPFGLIFAALIVLCTAVVPFGRKSPPPNWFLDQDRRIRRELGKQNMEFPHWLMIGGALLVLVGLVGSALQRRRPVAEPSSLDQGEVTELPKFLK